MTLPLFRYHPDPIRNKVAVPSRAPCPRCGVDRGLAYEGPFYTQHQIANLCFDCIADGSAAGQWQGSFVGSFGPEPLGDDRKLDELLHRTPGYFSAQGDPWPVHCLDYCALVGLVEWRDIEPIRDELLVDLEHLQATLQLSTDELVAELSRDASPLWAHLFRCLTCHRHRLVADYE